jgi:hypothetical protein
LFDLLGIEILHLFADVTYAKFEEGIIFIYIAESELCQGAYLFAVVFKEPPYAVASSRR